MKIVRFISDNILFIFTLFFIAFIPLYPKLPLIDIKNTWVYIRVEDVLVLIALFVFFFQLLRRKVSLKTPLTLPILIFWIIGAVVSIHGVLIIFPTLANVFPNVAFLSYIRRIEYLSLFFIAYSGIKDKRHMPYLIAVIVTTLLLVIGYGIGQRYLGFPAYLTMNEEYAKGLSITLSPLSRVSSTFGGHYDLAAYLVLVIPIISSLIFGVRKWFLRLLLLATVALGFVLLFMTVSRISFFVLLISLITVLFLHKKKFILLSLPVLAIVMFLLSLYFSQSLLQRFGNTVRKVDVLVDAKTGMVIGHVKKIPTDKFENKTVLQIGYKGKEDLLVSDVNLAGASSSSKIVPFSLLPKEVIEVVPPDTPTGENLPEGTGYVNLTLSPITARIGDFFYQKPVPGQTTESKYAVRYTGNFLIKRASTYDLSFTTRFQGEWPNAINAFKRNILFGSGYSSVSLAVDNNYLRIFGEVGILGFVSFFAIFIMIGIYIKKILPEINSPLLKSFVLGYTAGVIGIALNAIFIDVFEASKIAYMLWLLTGVTVGILHQYQTKNINLFKEFKNTITSPFAIIIYVSIFAIVVYSPLVRNYFVADDYTWLRWASGCSHLQPVDNCPSFITKVISYFTQADGFFYRPGTKTYFLIMYSVVWLNQLMYHIVSIILHISATVLMFLLVRKILRSSLLSALAAFIFLFLSSNSESVFWISATGHLFSAVFILLSLHLYDIWERNKKRMYVFLFMASFILSLLFYELGIVTPLLILLYKYTFLEKFNFRNMLKKTNTVMLFSPVILYLVVRLISGSHWTGGDYSYNLLKLPLNGIGNVIGYFLLSLLGPQSLPIYEFIRNSLKEQALLITVFLAGLMVALLFIHKALKSFYALIIHNVNEEDRRIIIFGSMFFVISLLPFLGFGNIAPRYNYLSSIGFVIIFVFLIKKVYNNLLINGKDITVAFITVMIFLFSLFHIIQIQQVHSDWFESGQKANNFLVSVDGLYSDYWSKEQMKFHLVNVPVKEGNAWVFPVGITDALWFVFQNPNINIHQYQNIDEALNSAADNRNEKVLLFKDSGRVVEIKRLRVRKNGEEVITIQQYE